jgi:hypothetical protein
MHRTYQKTLSATLIITLLLLPILSLEAIVLPNLISIVAGSSGNILINTTTSPSAIITIEIGGNVNLYLGGVTWSGGQVDLYLSSDGYASLSEDDVRYGPTFSVASITSGTPTTVDGYDVGNNWINGTIPSSLEIPGGNYYLKGFDGATSAVAVSDNYLTILSTFSVTPTSGPGQAAITLEAYALPANEYVNLSWGNGTAPGTWATIINLLQADELGRFTYSMTAPDLGAMLPSGSQPDTTNSTITFRMTENATARTVDDTFEEFWRGIKQVNGAMAGANALYGNATDLTATANLNVLSSYYIAGNHFHPGDLAILWDGTTEIGTATANATGWFNISVTVPITNIGNHWIVIDDTKVEFFVQVNVIPTLVLTPDEGPVGTAVTATGYGFPGSNSVVYNVTLIWNITDACTNENVTLGYVLTDGNGYFTFDFTVPHTVGGSHDVTAITNETTPTTAYDQFNVLATLVVTPDEFSNNGTIVTISGTGLAYYDAWYDLCLDNVKNFYSADESAWTTFITGSCTGDIEIEVIAAGFSPGWHAVSLYRLVNNYELPELEAHTLFWVEETSPLSAQVSALNDSLIDLMDFVMTDSDAIHDHLDDVEDAIDDAVSTLQEALDTEVLLEKLSSVEAFASDAAAKAASALSSADSAASSAGSAQTAAEAAKDAAEGASAATNNISMAVYGAIILSLIAALASIVAVITLQRKVA